MNIQADTRLTDDLERQLLAAAFQEVGLVDAAAAERAAASATSLTGIVGDHLRRARCVTIVGYPRKEPPKTLAEAAAPGAEPTRFWRVAKSPWLQRWTQRDGSPSRPARPVC